MRGKKPLFPSQAYMDISRQPSTLLKEPKEQLLILDLNGALVSRTNRNTCMYVRPNSNAFFDYIFKNFTVMVWSSAQPHSVDFMCRMFGPYRSQISAFWDRTSFGLNRTQFKNKVETIKDLNKVWAHFGYDKFNATNTILMDDSPSKVVLQPYNVVHPAEFEHNSTSFLSNGDSELIQIMNYLKKARTESNITNYFRNNPYRSELETEDNSFETLQYILSNGNKSEIVDFATKNKTHPMKF